MSTPDLGRPAGAQAGSASSPPETQAPVDNGGRAPCGVPAPTAAVSGIKISTDATLDFDAFGSEGHASPNSSNSSTDATIDLADSRRAAETELLTTDRKLAGIADYQLLEEIARGGMGVVYRAQQRSLNRIVAVKMILAGQLATAAEVERFLAEAESAANLQHPNIVSIYEVGETGGRHFFSMQFVEGRSLAETIRQQPMAVDEAARVVRVVADAVDYAHAHGILHRDLKPSNVLLDADGEPHLTDFGVAKRLQADANLTSTGTIIGTPSYMPPEQAAGSREIGRQADVYSLGAILYEALTGRPPFNAQRATDVLMQVLNSEPVSPRVLNPTIPQDLATICLKCLEKSPDRRYPTARALSSDLGRWSEGKPIEARPIGRAERFWRWCQRNPLPAGMAAMLVVVLVVAFFGVTSQWLVARSALQRMRVAQVKRAKAQVEGLLRASPDALTATLENLRLEHGDVATELGRAISRPDLSERDRIRLSMALLPNDRTQVDYLRGRMLRLGFDELLAVRAALAPHYDELQNGLWQVLDDAQAVAAERFAAALFLARSETEQSSRAEAWRGHATFITTQLLAAINADPSFYEPLVEALRPVSLALLPSLEAIFRDPNQPELTRALATNILVRFNSARPAELARLLIDSEPWQFLILRPRLTRADSRAMDVLVSALQNEAPSKASDSQREEAAHRVANAGVALIQLDLAEPVWPLMIHSEEPRVRSYLIELLPSLQTNPDVLLEQISEESDVSARRAILLALGGYNPESVSDSTRQAILTCCIDRYIVDPDAGIHSAAEWVLRRWDETARLPATEPQANATWIEGPEQHTLAIIDARAPAKRGSPMTEENRSVAEMLHTTTIGRRFAMGTKEVTIDQFNRFAKATGLRVPPYTKRHSPVGDGPIIMVTWYRAAQYCRWLSEQAGCPEEQMCYPPIGEIAEGMKPVEGYLKRTGFRLPTEAEWEFACRAGATTSRAFGSSVALLPRYAWYTSNAGDQAWPCGSLKPNDFGLFDMHGNVWEWCGERWSSYWEHPRRHDTADLTPIDAASGRVLRGGSFDSPAKWVRSAFRDRFAAPHFGSDEIGFRVVRTLPD